MNEPRLSEWRGCNYCDSGLAEAKRIAFWDGCNYCETCINNTLTGLAAYVREHDALEEELPFPWWRMIQVMGTGCLGVSFLIGGMFFAAFLFFPIAGKTTVEHLIHLTIASFAMCSAMFVMAVLVSPILALLFWLDKPHKLSVREGKIFVFNRWPFRLHDRAFMLTQSLPNPWPLELVAWSNGTTRRDKHIGCSLPWSPCIILSPAFGLQQFWKSGYAVGLTENTRQRWIAFFKLARVKKL